MLFRSLTKDNDEFVNQLDLYLSNHYHSFADVYHGCIAVMGYEWANEYLYSLKNEAERDRKSVV